MDHREHAERFTTKKYSFQSTWSSTKPEAPNRVTQQQAVQHTAGHSWRSWLWAAFMQFASCIADLCMGVNHSSPSESYTVSAAKEVKIQILKSVQVFRSYHVPG